MARAHGDLGVGRVGPGLGGAEALEVAVDLEAALLGDVDDEGPPGGSHRVHQAGDIQEGIFVKVELGRPLPREDGQDASIHLGPIAEVQDQTAGAGHLQLPDDCPRATVAGTPHCVCAEGFQARLDVADAACRSEDVEAVVVGTPP